ncbi:glycosyltransferase family 2 protein [Roseiflexus castenholzii]|uniref:Glycosyl transferase family 2 n=1 Tax=Roseiflexus castenholzii (strain DSM 13941 / HLO8) TaxID=383372 RepID=A7NNK8_ROSCS|nr:glycosyltransferase family 2 protein [Roseiflexus castenholzii]ABU59149.1 glycosyl transferase family 2 [Roseiflexus castenholzii DSM 13941]
MTRIVRNDNPRVSIGLPVYNGQHYLRQALDSLLSQTFHDFEVIISDNASDDATPEICRKYAAHDARIRYVRHDVNRGASWNFNYVFGLARGVYFKWHAHDDMLEPTFLERCVAALDHSPRVVLAFSRTRVVDPDGNTLYTYDERLRTDSPRASIRFHDLICVGHPCFQVFGVIRADVLRRTPLIGAYVPSDRILLARLGLLGAFYEAPEHLFISRRHPTQSVRAAKLRARAAWFDPANEGKIVMPHFRTLYEYIKAIRETPLPPDEARRCYGALLHWIAADLNWARLGNDVVHAARQLSRRALRRIRALNSTTIARRNSL